MMRLRFSQADRQAYSLLAPSLVIFLCLLIYPLIEVFRMSLYDITVWGEAFIGLGNYRQLIHDKLFWQALSQTVYFVVWSVVFHFLIALGLALILHQKISPLIRSFFRGVFILPWLISPTVAAMIWVLVFTPFGVLNGLLTSLGILSQGQTIAWLGSPATSLWSVTLVNIWRGFPFSMVMLLAGLQAIPEELYEASMMDGANVWRRFIHITLPCLKGVIGTVVLLDVIWTFRHFDLIFVMTGGGPVNSSEVLATSIYAQAFRNLKMGYASAQAIAMFGILFVLSLGYIRRMGGEGAES